MHMYVFKRVERDEEETYGLCVPENVRYNQRDFPSIADIAKRVREILWERSGNGFPYLEIHFAPLADIECLPKKVIARCFPIEENEQEIFWQIFSRTKEDAELLASMMESI